MYELRNVNQWQTPSCRRAKYRVLISLGFPPESARRFRDYRLKELIKIVLVYFGSKGGNPQEARDILDQEIRPLELTELSHHRKRQKVDIPPPCNPNLGG